MIERCLTRTVHGCGRVQGSLLGVQFPDDLALKDAPVVEFFAVQLPVRAQIGDILEGLAAVVLVEGNRDDLVVTGHIRGEIDVDGPPSDAGDVPALIAGAHPAHDQQGQDHAQEKIVPALGNDGDVQVNSFLSHTGQSCHYLILADNSGYSSQTPDTRPLSSDNVELLHPNPYGQVQKTLFPVY